MRGSETSAEGRSIYAHDPKGKVAEAYRALTKEVLQSAEKNGGKNISLTSYDDIFSTEESRQTEQISANPHRRPASLQKPPLQGADDEAMQRTVESVAQFGVLAPLVVRAAGGRRL